MGRDKPSKSSHRELTVVKQVNKRIKVNYKHTYYNDVSKDAGSTRQQNLGKSTVVPFTWYDCLTLTVPSTVLLLHGFTYRETIRPQSRLGRNDCAKD